jgi:hypothetical protein
MALWLKTGRRWQRAHALRSYYPPGYLRLYPAASGPRWRVTGAVEDYGSDELGEFIAALISACRRPKEGAAQGLWRLEGGSLVPSPGIAPFSPEGVLSPGVELLRLERPPDRWLVTLHLARAARGLLAAQVERYLGSWHTALEELLRACRPPSDSSPRRS